MSARVHSINRLIWFSLLSLMLSGCSEVFVIEEDPGNRYYLPPKGTLVRLNDKLTVPPPWARVFIQRGEIVSYGDLDRYYPSCNFEVNDISQKPQFIEPGEFVIYKIARRDEYLVKRTPALYAGPIDLSDVQAIEGGQIMLAEGQSSSSSSMVMRTVRMKLKSEKQPHVYMLTCRGAQDMPSDAEFVSINEMQEALGGKAVIVLPEDQ